jgi:DNA-binding MarR family transcriptional regulator
VLALTPDGDRLRARAAERLERCDDAFLAPLSAAERTQLRAALRRLASG